MRQTLLRRGLIAALGFAALLFTTLGTQPTTTASAADIFSNVGCSYADYSCLYARNGYNGTVNFTPGYPTALFPTYTYPYSYGYNTYTPVYNTYTPVYSYSSTPRSMDMATVRRSTAPTLATRMGACRIASSRGLAATSATTPACAASLRSAEPEHIGSAFVARDGVMPSLARFIFPSPRATCVSGKCHECANAVRYFPQHYCDVFAVVVGAFV